MVDSSAPWASPFGLAVLGQVTIPVSVRAAIRPDWTGRGRGAFTTGMPPARDDARLLVFAAGTVLAAGLAVAVLLLVSTGRGGAPPEEPEPVALGFESSTRERLAEGPDFIPDQFGEDRSFWLLLEDGAITAIATHQEALPDCTVRWRGRIDRFVCGDARFQSHELERFEVRVPRSGADDAVVTIDVRRRLPPPAEAAGGN